jgi:hypothetical protein
MNYLYFVDDAIQKAMDEGKFDNLPGQGKPLPKDENPYSDSDTAYKAKLLANAGFESPYLSAKNEINELLTEAATDCRRAWRWYSKQRAAGVPPARRDEDWTAAQGRFQERIAILNRRVLDFNLMTPVPSMHLRFYDADLLLKDIQAEG